MNQINLNRCKKYLLTAVAVSLETQGGTAKKCSKVLPIKGEYNEVPLMAGF